MAVLNWIKANPEAAIGLALYATSNLAVALTKMPQTAGVGAALLKVADFIALLPHKDAQGVFGALNLPGFASRKADS